MTSILDMHSGSSDSEDDCDYVPPTNAVSDESEELSEDESEFLEGPASKKAKLSDNKDENKTPVVKKSDDDIWKSFLQGVETTSCKKPSQKAELTTSATVSKSESQDNIKNERVQSKIKEDNATIDPISNKPNAETKLIEKCKPSHLINSTLEAESIANKDNDKVTTKPIAPASNKAPVARGGISSILGAIANKEKKVTVLQKSLQDWNSFKEDEGIGKDLETYNKGRQGYIERQRFLQRSDLLSYEKEREMRLFGKKR